MNASRQEIVALAGFLFIPGPLSAQDPLPPVQFNVPYRCTDGRAFVIERCEAVRRGELCYLHTEVNGRREGDRVMVRSQLTGILNSCPPPSPTPAQTAPAARTANPAPPAPKGIPNRPTDPPHLQDMPTPERVLHEIRGADPTDRLARQLAVISHLQREVEHMMDPKRYRKTPDEEQVIYTYSYAIYEINQSYAKSHTPEEVKALTNLQGRYDLDNALFREMIEKFYTPAIRAAQSRVNAAFEAKYKARVEQSKQDSARMLQPDTPAQQPGSPFVRNDPGTLAARRCVELGGSDLGCVGKGLMTGLFGGDMAGVLTGDKPARSGLTMTGRYAASGSPAIWFDTDSMSVSGCGKLITRSYGYSVARTANRFTVSVLAEPKPFALSLAPDGVLTGPGPIDLKGQIITGYRKVWMQAYANGAPLVAGQCNGSCGYWAQEPIYADKIERCTFGALRPAGPTGTAGSAIGMAAGMAAGQSIEQAARTAAGDLPEPGVRLAGTYSSPGGLRLEFHDDSVILDCGEAHVARKYAVANGPAEAVITVGNADAPFKLSVLPNGGLSGSGSVPVIGRVVTGSTPSGIAFGQRNATCGLGLLTAGTAPTSSVASTSSMAAPAAGSAVLTISSGLPTQPGHPNPMAGLSLYLVNESFSAVATRSGVRPGPGQSPVQAWGAACNKQSPECGQAMAAIKARIVARGLSDQAGRTAFPPQPAGRYHVFGFMLFQGHHLVWDLPADLKDGPNSLVLDERNAAVIQ